MMTLSHSDSIRYVLHGISTAALVDRVDAGEDLQALADDYRLIIAQVEDAILYERAA